MTHTDPLAALKKYFPYALVALCMGVAYLYFSLSKDIKHLDDNRAVVTNHWTGEVKRCIVTPNQNWACNPADPIAVPSYMSIVQNTFESFN